MIMLDIYWREILIASLTLLTVWLLLKTDRLRAVVLLFGALAIWTAAVMEQTPVRTLAGLQEKAHAVVFRVRDMAGLR
jgi:hypothetical protein